MPFRNGFAITIGCTSIFSYYSSGETCLKLHDPNLKENRIVLNSFSQKDHVRVGIELKDNTNTTNWDRNVSDHKIARSFAGRN